jgi:hypothetical protein
MPHFYLPHSFLDVCEIGYRTQRISGTNHQRTASTQTALHCAPLKSSVVRESSSKLTSGLTVILREWICMMRARASSFGWGNSIFLSKRPERRRAGSKMSTRLVAAITWKLSIIRARLLTLGSFFILLAF